MEKEYQGHEGAQLPAERAGESPRKRSNYQLQPDPFGGQPDEGIDWRQLGATLWERKWWIVAATIVGVATGMFLSQQVRTSYETRATLWLEPASQGQGDVETGDVIRGQGWAELFVSSTVLEPVVRDLKLNVSPIRRNPGGDVVESFAQPVLSSFGLGEESAGRPRAPSYFRDVEFEEEVAPGRYELRVQADDSYELALARTDSVVESGRLNEPIGQSVGMVWSVAPDALPADGSLAFRLQDPTSAVRSLRDRITVVFNSQASNLIRTQLRWESAESATQVHNRIVQSFMETASRLKTQKLRQVVNILSEQTRAAEARLDSAELALENFTVETITLPSERGLSVMSRDTSTGSGSGEGGDDSMVEGYFERKLRADQTREDLRRLRELRSRMLASSDTVETIAIRSVGAVARSSEIGESLEELSELEADRRSLLYTFTEQHPEVRKVEKRIEDLRSNVIPRAMGDLIAQLERELQNLEQRIAQQGDELREIPRRTISEARLEREVEIAEELYNSLRERLSQARMATSTRLPNLQVVDRAESPQPINARDGSRLLILASLAGFGLGITGVVVHDQLDQRLRSPDDVRDLLGLPVLGLIPHIDFDDDLDREQALELLEAFRALREQVARGGAPERKTVMITSSTPQEGKSLISANLAISYALAGWETLIIDADTRRGNQELFFDLPGEPGLTDYLEDEKSITDIVHETGIENLALIPHGDLDHFSHDLINGRRMRELLGNCRRKYDVVILDTPPLVAGVDPLILGDEADQSLLVVRSGQTDRRTLSGELDNLERFDIVLSGVVLNAVKKRAPYYSSYYYSYPHQGATRNVVT